MPLWQFDYNRSRLYAHPARFGVHYDRVLALSERFINRALDDLLRTYKQLRSVKINDDNSGVNLEINSFRVIIPASQYTLGAQGRVLLVLDIESGSVAPPMNSDDKPIPFKGWKIAVPCDLAEPKAPSGDAAPDERIHHQIGDYSIERLFAQFATASWSRPLEKYSIVKDPKTDKPCKFSDWEDENKDTWKLLANALEHWAGKMGTLHKATLGWSFKLVAKPGSSPASTSPSSYLFQETYPHLSKEFLEKFSRDYNIPASKDNSTEGRLKEPLKQLLKEQDASEFDDLNKRLLGQGLNCLLWCEMVKTNLPQKTREISWFGNYATESSNVGTWNGSESSLVTTRYDFVEQYILPILREFNQAVELTDLSVDFPTTNETQDREALKHPNKLNYNVGKKTISKDDKAYAYTHKIPDNPAEGDIYPYVFEKRSENPQRRKVEGFGELPYNFETTLWSTLAWTPGGNTYHYSVTVEVYYGFDDLKGFYGRFKAHYTWNIPFQVVFIENGQLKFTFDEEADPKHFPGEVFRSSYDVSKFNATINSQTDPYLPRLASMADSDIFSKLQKIVSPCSHELIKRLNSTSKYVLPGTDVLEYSKPMINWHGDVVANVQFKQLQPSDGYVTTSSTGK